MTLSLHCIVRHQQLQQGLTVNRVQGLREANLHKRPTSGVRYPKVHACAPGSGLKMLTLGNSITALPGTCTAHIPEWDMCDTGIGLQEARMTRLWPACAR